MTSRELKRLIGAISEPAFTVCSSLQREGFEASVVGGAVRDLVRGTSPGDFDIATDAKPEEVIKCFRRVIPTGIKHGTVTVMIRSDAVEVTTYRTESGYSDQRRPDSVQYVSSLLDDLSRRDFTFNGMALDPVKHIFTDPYSGREDLGNRIVRAIGDPAIRFSEDALRMLRAVRFATQLDATIEEHTRAALVANVNSISRVSAERVRDELVKIMSAGEPSRGFRILRDIGMLPIILPELAEGVGVEQRGDHVFDVFEHSIRACDYAPAGDLMLRLAALLHDIGKPRALVVASDGPRTFHGHEKLSASMAEDLLKRLKFSNAIVAGVTNLVKNHMFGYTSEWSDAAVRRFISRVGEDSVESVLRLRMADSQATAGIAPDLRALEAIRGRVESIREAQQAFTVSGLAVDGNDLNEAGIPKGPSMGTVLRHLLETVLDDPEQNTRECLTKIAVEFYRTRIVNAGNQDKAAGVDRAD